MRARFYSPEIKRFVNRDVMVGNVSEEQSLNRFVFVTGNPLNFLDPFGLEKEFLTETEIQELFKRMATLDLAFDQPKSGCEARAHLMAQEIIKLFDYTPYKVWAISFKNELAVKGREREGLKGWGFHVSVMIKSGDGREERWVIDPALFHQAVGVEEWKNLLSGWEHTSESKFGEPPWITRHGSTYQLSGSYVFDILDSKFLPYYPKMEVGEAINQEAKKMIECIKHPVLCRVPWLRGTFQ